ncbi:MAG: hypothetical protein CMG71_05145 [Candidatus Marinimicrobia bacterium]|nr:hypothetical protein [Candidatus Neomarinimicrobiota bacterium]
MNDLFQVALRLLRGFFFVAVPVFLTAQPPEITVSGVVIDSRTGEPLFGVNIVAGDAGTATNDLGEFALTVPPGTELEFSHIGFFTVTIPANNTMLTVELLPRILPTDELIVTAGLTSEPLQRITSSVALLGRPALSVRNEVHLQAVVETIPNLHFAGGTSRPRYFQIRGIGERSHYAGEGTPNFSVGFVMDDVDLSGLGMAGFMTDLHQVEVFRGPQSSIFGPNALAGLISLRSVDPADQFSATVRFTRGSNMIDRRETAFGGPLGASLAYRISYLSSYVDGFRNNVYKNIYTGNDRDETMLRAKLRFAPTEQITLLGTFFRASLENGYEAWSPDNNTFFYTFGNDAGEDSQRTDATSLRATVRLSRRLTLTSITAFSATELTHSYDGDWANEQFWMSSPYNFDPAVEGWNYEFFDRNDRDRSSLTQDLRIGYGTLVAGVYLKSMEEKDNATGWLYGGDATEMTSTHNFTATAGYTQFELLMGTRLTLRASARLERNRMVYDGKAGGYDENWNFIQLNPVDYSTDYSLLGGRASISYQIRQGSQLFAAVARGYKAGGVNQHPYLAETNRLFNPEYILNGEIGYRTGRKNFSFSSLFFAAKRTEQQVSISSQQREGDPNSFFYYTANATSGSLLGAELDGRLALGESFELTGSLGLLLTKIDPFTFESSAGKTTTLGGREAAHAPGYSFTLTANYNQPSGLFVRMELIAKDEFYYSESHDQMSGAYQLFNGHIGYRRGSWAVKLWGRNLLDERYATRGFYFGLEPPDYEDKLYVSWGDPRHFGVTLEFNL